MAQERAGRADAQANRQRIIDAARALYAEEGLDVSFNAIAQRACVGSGTLYRHFGDHEELREAVFRDRVQQATDTLVELAELDEPAVELRRYLAWIRETADLSLFGLAGARWTPSAAAKADATRLKDLLDDLVERAHRVGALRADVEREDLLVAAVALIKITRNPRIPPNRSERFLSVVLGGLGLDSGD